MDTIQYLSNKVHLLELKIDSLQKAESIKELSLKINEQADIVSNVGSFYESAWLKLIIVISLLVGIFGVVVPLLIQYFQKSNLKEVTNFLSKEVKDVFELKINNLKESNDSQFEILSSKINTELLDIQNKHSLMSNEIEASLFYLQGKQNFSNNRTGSALKDFVRSAEHWLESSKPERVEVVLKNIRGCILKLKTKVLFENAISESQIDWDHFQKKMSEKLSSGENFELIKTAINQLEL